MSSTSKESKKPFFEAVLITILLLSVPKVAISHVGHGDEFQATGDVQRVQVNAETDQMLGIAVNPIEQATADGTGVFIPVTALVDADGKQLVFVQYENFYEPVPVITGATQGELIEVSEGLSVGENLVTQGSLSLYAESRKTQTADAAPNSDVIASPQTDATHAQADAQGIPHSHDAAGNLTSPPGETTPSSVETAQQTGEPAQPSSGFSIGKLAIVGGGMALLLGALSVMGGNRKKKSAFSNKKGGY
ncbi:MAG: cobalt transporter [Elainella sp. C42_A2020_010]|nr:cobalt transporter [Elainella sp. C42_A2020_010]